MNEHKNYKNLKMLLLTELSNHLVKVGLQPTEVGDEMDLLKSGVIDSLDFIILVESLEEKHGLIFDFSRVSEPDISVMKVFITEILKQNS